MKILWVNTNFLHPATKGGQIRSLEMLRVLCRRHEIHYVAIEDPDRPEGPSLSREYAARAYPIRHRIPPKKSFRFLGQAAKGLISSMPVAVSRFYSPEIGHFLEELMRRERFDRAVCDHLAPSAHFPRLDRALLFQHNVETMIWRRRASYTTSPVRSLFLNLQARRMFEYEKRICCKAGRVVAVSEEDACFMRERFGASRVSAVPTGVNLGFFSRPSDVDPIFDLVFIGSMDWDPNADGMLHFVRNVLPIIRQSHPHCSVAIVGRSPGPRIRELAVRDPKIRVTGTVPDIRPYLWCSSVSIVPLRIGGGTRLKIYEAMAAGIPVVSTTIGAEGLDVNPPVDIRIGDSPEEFAAHCIELLKNSGARRCQARAAWELVSSRYSWEKVTQVFEDILVSTPLHPEKASGAEAQRCIGPSPSPRFK